MYNITEGFSPILCYRPDVITLGNPFDTRVPDYSSSSFFVFFSKNEEEAIPPGGKKYLRTKKASTEGFNDWGGRGYDDFVPGEVTKTAPSGDETT